MQRPLRVVIADDHELFRAEMRHDLTAAGLDVCGEAADGAGAVAAVELQAPDACLLDVGMPGGGIEAAAAIAAGDHATVVVMLSAFDDQETFGCALDAGVRGYLLKDFDGRRIADALSRAVAGERVGAPAFLRLATLRDAASAGAR